MSGIRALLCAVFLWFSLCGSAGAQVQCNAESLQINVLPFELVQDFSKSFGELQEIAAGQGLVGLVRTISTAKLDGCTLTVGYLTPVLYVASELRRNRCSFDHVLEHELEHVRIYRTGLAEFDARIRAGVAAGKAPASAAWDEIAHVREQHQMLDSEDEYARNRTACHGSIVTLAFKG